MTANYSNEMEAIPRWLSLAKLTRLPAVFSAISNVVAAGVIAAAGDTAFGPLLGCVVATTCLYLSGMVLNDCFDVEEDRLERPERPIPSGAVSLTQAWLLAAALMGVGVFSSFMVGARTGLISLALAAMIIFYDGFCSKGFCSKGLIRACAMAGCRYLNWLLGLSIVSLGFPDLLLPLPLFFYIASLTLLSEQETRAENKSVLWLVGGGMALVPISLVAIPLFVNPQFNYWGAVLGTIALVVIVRHLYRLGENYGPEFIQKTIKFLLMGIIVLDGIMLISGGYWVWAVLVCLLLIPGKWLGKKIYVT